MTDMGEGPTEVRVRPSPACTASAVPDLPAPTLPGAAGHGRNGPQDAAHHCGKADHDGDDGRKSLHAGIVTSARPPFHSAIVPEDCVDERPRASRCEAGRNARRPPGAPGQCRGNPGTMSLGSTTSTGSAAAIPTTGPYRPARRSRRTPLTVTRSITSPALRESRSTFRQRAEPHRERRHRDAQHPMEDGGRRIGRAPRHVVQRQHRDRLADRQCDAHSTGRCDRVSDRDQGPYRQRDGLVVTSYVGRCGPRR